MLSNFVPSKVCSVGRLQRLLHPSLSHYYYYWSMYIGLDQTKACVCKDRAEMGNTKAEPVLAEGLLKE